MPFQSEKQRKYLWANEPEIARRWTKEHGSRIQKDDGGIMRIPFAEGEDYWRYKIDSFIEDELGDKWEDKFDKLNEKDRNALETEFRADNITKEEIRDFINIKGERKQIDYLKDMWNEGKFYGQKTNPEIAEGNFKDELNNRFGKIRQYKKKYPKSKIIQEAKAPLEGIKPQFASVLEDLPGSPSLDDFMNERLEERIEKEKRKIEEQLGIGGAGLPSLPKEPFYKEADPGQPVWDFETNKYYDAITGREVPNPNIPQKRNMDTMPYIKEPFSPIAGFASFTDDEKGPVFNPLKLMSNPQFDEDVEEDNVPLRFKNARYLSDYFNPQQSALRQSNRYWNRGDTRTVPERFGSGLRNVGGDIRNIGQKWMKGFRNVRGDIGRGIGRLMGDRFQKRPAVSSAGGYSAAQLNQMNALGGYYSQPARAARRVDQRRINILNRAAAGKPVGNVSQLLGPNYSSDGGGGIQFTGTPAGDPTAGAGYSRKDDSWSASPFARGGLASIWPR